MNDSVPESVEVNGNSVTAENVTSNGLVVLPDDDHEENIGSPQESNNVDSPIKVESPGGSVHSTRKGFGLKKWRRIKRDGPVKDEATPIDDGSKLLKRGLTGSVNPPPYKHLDLSSIEAMQSSEGSVGSVNMVQHHLPGAKNVGGKIVSDRIKKEASEERGETKKEKPSSSMNFVFSSGAASVEKNERLTMNHVKEAVKTYSRGENMDKEENGDESKKNHQFWADKDQLADSIRSFAALQEALWKEVQSFQDLGKESTPLHSNVDELSSSVQSRNENCGENNSASSGSQVLILKQKVKHLEHKLEEAKAVLEAKETRIQELENSKIESELQDIFQRKIETEIEHLVLTRSVNSSLQVLKQPKKLDPTAEDPEGNSGNMLGKTCKFGFYFLTQMILLVSIFAFLVLQFSPASQLVTPT